MSVSVKAPKMFLDFDKGELRKALRSGGAMIAKIIAVALFALLTVAAPAGHRC
jgi:hypothetical protein